MYGFLLIFILTPRIGPFLSFNIAYGYEVDPVEIAFIDDIFFYNQSVKIAHGLIDGQMGNISYKEDLNEGEDTYSIVNIDRSDPIAPGIVLSLNIPDNIKDLSLEDPLLSNSRSTGGTWMIDLEEPDVPRLQDLKTSQETQTKSRLRYLDGLIPHNTGLSAYNFSQYPTSSYLGNWNRFPSTLPWSFGPGFGFPQDYQFSTWPQTNLWNQTWGQYRLPSIYQPYLPQMTMPYFSPIGFPGQYPIGGLHYTSLSFGMTTYTGIPGYPGTLSPTIPWVLTQPSIYPNIKKCIGEGRTFGSLPPSSTGCCKGLTGFQYRSYVDDICSPVMDLFICLSQDGICDPEYENKCNLPEDCGCDSSDECRDDQICYEEECIEYVPCDSNDDCLAGELCKYVDNSPDSSCSMCEQICVPAVGCGNKVCEVDENCVTCSEDCGEWPYGDIESIPTPKDIEGDCSIQIETDNTWRIYTDLTTGDLLTDTENNFTANELKDWIYEQSGGNVNIDIFDIPENLFIPNCNRIVIGNPNTNTKIAAVAADADIDINEKLAEDVFDQGYVILIERTGHSSNEFNQILILANDTTGTFYGVMTMTWLLKNENFDIDHWSLPYLKIVDWPDTEIRVFWGGGGYISMPDPLGLDKFENADNWEYSGTAGLTVGDPCDKGDDYFFLINSGEDLELETPISTFNLTGITVYFNWVTDSGTTFHLDYSIDEGQSWIPNYSNSSTTWKCNSYRVLPEDVENIPNLSIRFRVTGVGTSGVDNVRIGADFRKARIEMLARYKYNMWPHAMAKDNGAIDFDDLANNGEDSIHTKLMEYSKKHHFFSTAPLNRQHALDADPSNDDCIGIVDEPAHNLGEGWWAKDVHLVIDNDIAIPFEGATDNIVYNPSFEDVTAGVPDNWSFIGNSDDSYWEVDSTTSHSGNNSVKLTIAEDLSGSCAYLKSPYYPLDPDRVYQMSAWVKQSNKTGKGAQLTAVLCASVIAQKDYSDWTRLSVTFGTFNDTDEFYLYSRALFAEAGMTFWIDDIEIRDVTALLSNVIKTPSTILTVCSDDDWECQFVKCYNGFYDLNDNLDDGCEYECDPTNPEFDVETLCTDGEDNDCDGDTDGDDDDCQ